MHRTLWLLPVALLLTGCSLWPLARPQQEGLASDNIAAVPNWIEREHLPPAARPGATLFAKLPCLNCHTYLGSGSANLGAPDLSAEGARGRGVAWQVAHLECPACVKDGSPMPAFKAIGAANLHRLAVFLEASRGAK